QLRGVPADALTVRDGVISVTAAPQRRVSYGDLIGGQPFHHKLEWNKQYGNPLLAKGQATPKPPSDYKVVGRSIPQRIVSDKAFGKLKYVTDIRVDGMLHARVVRPPTAGCAALTVDESSVASIPGARVIRDKEFVAVVAEREWDAVRAARALKITWSAPCTPFPDMEA